MHHLPSQLQEVQGDGGPLQEPEGDGEAETAVGWWFQAYKWDPEQKTELRSGEIFKYLGRVVANGDYNTSAIQRNLKRARVPNGGGCKR